MPVGGKASQPGRARRLAATGATLSCLLALAVPSAARAEVKPVSCSKLQSTIESLAIKPDHGEGDTLVLGELCTASSLGLAGKGVTIPAKVGFTLQGTPGAGIDGAAISGPLLASAGFEAAGALTIEGLTFEHASTSDASAVSLRASRVTIAGDSFLENSEQGVSAAALFVFAGEPAASTCPAPGGPPAFVLRGSVLRGNTVTVASGDGGGGAAFLEDACTGAAHLIEGNVVEGNVLRSKGAGELTGGGIEVASEAATPSPLAQRGNVFASNRIEDETALGNFGGGGEWVLGMSLSSVADRFSGNSITGTASGHWSWGAGLGLLGCHGTGRVASTLENAVVDGNAIVGGNPAEDNGAGVYVGFGCVNTATTALSLLDSTVTANSAPSGGTAGIAGGPSDALALANSILAGDIGGGELSGFTGAEGSLSSTFSDTCAPGTASPLPGEGNICAAPFLTDAGNPASADARETAASPTREAGSNALVPAGLTTDYYGSPRIAGGVLQATCSQGLVPFAAARVDMGAAELQEPLVRPLMVICPAAVRVLRSSFAFPHVSVRPGGVLVLTFHDLGRSTLLAQAHVRLTETVVRTVHGHRRRVRRSVSVLYAQIGKNGMMPATLRVRLVPKKRALQALRRRHRLAVKLTVTYAASRLLPDTQSRTVTVHWIAPPKKHHT